jgi:hypothetical protein
MRGPSRSRVTLIALSIVAASASAVPVSAATIALLDRSLAPEAKVLRTEFGVDERTGSARVVVDLYDDSWDGYLTSESVAVPGLRFDRERREVVFESGGSVVTCARPRKVLWGKIYPATGACRILVRSESRDAAADRGTPASKEWVVELVTDEPTKAAALGARN